MIPATLPLFGVVPRSNRSESVSLRDTNHLEEVESELGEIGMVDCGSRVLQDVGEKVMGART